MMNIGIAGFPARVSVPTFGPTGRMLTIRELCEIMRSPRKEVENLIVRHGLPVARNQSGVSRVGLVHVVEAVHSEGHN